MIYKPFQSTETCTECNLKEICDLGIFSAPRYSVIACEARIRAVKEYGGKNKLLTEIYTKFKEADNKQKIENNQEFSMEILNKYLERLSK